jgi:hypothetical protein
LTRHDPLLRGRQLAPARASLGVLEELRGKGHFFVDIAGIEGRLPDSLVAQIIPALVFGKLGQFAAMVAPFVPGIGTGIGAELGAANALAAGEPITDALLAAARSAIPGRMQIGGSMLYSAQFFRLQPGGCLFKTAMLSARGRQPILMQCP